MHVPADRLSSERLNDMKIFSDEPGVREAREHSGRIVRAMNELAALVQVAWDRRYDRVLKYKSWQDYCTGEFGAGEAAIRARQVVGVMLHNQGLTEKNIAAELGVSQPTVNRDLAAQPDYTPVRGGSTADERRERRRNLAFAAADPEPVMPDAAPALAESFHIWTQEQLARAVSQYQGAGPGDDALSSPEDAVEVTSPLGEVFLADREQQDLIQDQYPAATIDQPASLLVPEPPVTPGPLVPAARERFLQGDTDGARSEIRRRVLAGEPVRREQIAAQFGVSEMFARQATMVEETAAGIPDTAANCIRELTALRAKYQRVLAGNAWADQCLQLIIDSLRNS